MPTWPSIAARRSARVVLKIRVKAGVASELRYSPPLAKRTRKGVSVACPTRSSRASRAPGIGRFYRFDGVEDLLFRFRAEPGQLPQAPCPDRLLELGQRPDPQPAVEQAHPLGADAGQAQQLGDAGRVGAAQLLQRRRGAAGKDLAQLGLQVGADRSEERRVGKGWRAGWRL